MQDTYLSRLWRTLSDWFYATGYLLKEISTPDAPDQYYNRLYVKSDGKLYQRAYGGSEEEVGGGGGGGLPLGTIIFSFAGAITGADSVATSQGNGWALCNGTTGSSQVSGATITATIPDFNGDKRFFRPYSSAGTTQNHQMQGHTHSFEDYQSVVKQLMAVAPISVVYYDASSDSSGNNTGNAGSETRPDNYSVIAMMRVR